MSNIVSGVPESNDRRVQAGEKADSLLPISMYQDIYHQITGRTEKDSKSYKNNLLIDFSGIEDLHYKILQLCDVHDVIASNEVVTIIYDQDRKTQFTSFERFKLHQKGSSSPTLAIVMKYNFSIVPPGRARPQEYVVTVHLTSRVTALKKMQKEGVPFNLNIFMSYLTADVVEVEVEFVDYVIARGFMEAIDEWVRGCKSTPSIHWILIARRFSHFLSPLLRISSSILIAIFALNSIPFLIESSNSTYLILRGYIIYGVSFFIFNILFGVAGRMIERSIDNYPFLSYINLNGGDEKLIEDFVKRRKRVVFRGFLGLLWSLALGVCAAKIEKFI